MFVKFQMTFLSQKIRLILCGAFLVAYLGNSAWAVDGHIPNQSYDATNLFKQISPQLSDLHLNQPSVFNGYLIFAGNGIHEVWDIANPFAPVKKATMNSNFRFGEAESHQVTYAKMPDGTTYLATISGRGVDIWNMTTTTNPVLLGEIQLPGINYGDVAGGIWGVAWQGKYIYAGATVNGIYIIDVSNPAAPVHVGTVSQLNLGGVSAGPLFALGNLLVVTTPKDSRGVATVDISNPLAPKLLDSVASGNNSYIGGFYGGNAYLITPLRTYDVTTDPANIQLLSQTNTPFGEYVSFANDHLFFGGLRGGTHGIWKYNITNATSPVLVGRYVGRDTAWDDQFSCPIGNLLAVADDQFVSNKYVGGLLAVHDLNPDTNGPTVMKVFPADGAINQPLSTRIAVSLSEWPELATVNASNFIVRPVGGAALEGVWSCTYTVLNFAPTTPLQPNTLYEIVLTAGGVCDLVRNPIATQFQSTFRTSYGVTGFPGDPQVQPVPPTPLGAPTVFALAQPAASGTTYEWEFGDGSNGFGSTVNHTYAAPGRYVVTLRATQSTALLEAENATLSGGVSVASGNPGWTGSGFADFPGGTGTNVFVRWTFNVPSPLTTNITIVYANGGATPRPLQLVVNDGPPQTLPFPSTGAWTTYLPVVVSEVTLLAGTNTVQLQATAGSVGGNIDSLSVPLPSSETLLTSFRHIVHRPLTALPPANASPLALANAGQTLWVANPDTDTVTALHATTLAVLGEYPVGDQPETLAAAPDGSIWVANHKSASLSVLNTNGASLQTIALPYGSRPYAVAFAPDGSHAFVTLEALGRILKLNPATRAITGSLDLPADANGIRPQIRGLAVSSTSDKLFVTRFISPDSAGQVYEINPASMTLTRTIALAIDAGPDTSISGRGLPNYLNAIAITPDGTRAWLPSKKDNIQRGTLRDGLPLTHDLTVRAISSVIELASGLELPGERSDFDNRDRAHDVAFSTLGDLAFVTLPGNQHVQVVDAYSGQEITQLPAGTTPTGVLLDPAQSRLFVLNFLGRSLSVFNVADLINGIGNAAPAVGAPVPLITTEALAPQVLAGKKFFYDAASTRLNEEGYMSCASCHLDGAQDGRIWDFTGGGEGLRNTIDLRGRAGTAHGRLHWSANFDEVHDFEGQIRTLGAGTGLMNDPEFNTANRSQSLGLAKHGVSADLDALAAYVASLNEFPASPHRNADGSLTTNALAGRTLFNQLQCFTCHGGTHFTDSPLGGSHNVGTLKSSSGQRLSGPLTGIDTPTLRGVWATAPYLHDGSAPTLRDVLVTANPTNAHGATSTLTPTELDQLVAYLQQIDGNEPAAAPATSVGLPTFAGFAAGHGLPAAPLQNSDGDSLNDLLEYALGGTSPTNASAALPAQVTVTTNSSGAFYFSFLRQSGGYWQDGNYFAADLAYTPGASFDLLNWSAGFVQVPPLPGLPPAPVGYEWTSYQVPGATNQGFGRVRVELR